MDVYDRWEHAGVIVEIVPDERAASPQENDNAGTIYSWTTEFAGDEQIPEPNGSVDCPVCRGDWAGVRLDYFPGGRAAVECRKCSGYGYVNANVSEWFAAHYNSVLTIPLRFADYGSSGSCLYECDEGNANCALVFTQEEVDKEWDGHVESYQVPAWRAVFEDGKPILGYGDGFGPITGSVPNGTGESGARPYAKARIKELDHWFRGNVFGIVIRELERDHEHCHEVGSCWSGRPCGCSEGKHLASVWGFIGEPDAEWIREEAEEMAEDAALGLKEEADEVAYWAARGMVTV